MPKRPLSQEDLLGIVALASTLDERLSKTFLPEEAQADDAIGNAQLEAWCQLVAKGDWNQFRRRLAYDGLDMDTARQALGATRLPEGSPSPAWTDTLLEVLNLSTLEPGGRTAGSQTDEHSLLFLDPKRPLPFEEIIAPFVVVAQQKLTTRTGTAYRLLGDSAHIILQRHLLQTLIFYSAQALYLEFSIERERVQSSLDRLVAQVQSSDNRALYQQFVECMHQGGLVSFFREYAVLARLLATITNLWIAAQVEFLLRLASDWPELQQVFGIDGPPGRVVSVEPSLSDPHRGRRTVIALTFASGQKLVYKPKDLGMERSYYRLLTWFNEQNIPLPFKVLSVLNRSNYGWVEFVEHESCQDQGAVQRYYQRAGMLLCLVYALEGTDCHCENIIASGEHPVLVDCETLLHHRPRLETVNEGTIAQYLAEEEFAHSVLRTGLLPSWQVRSDEQGAYDVSGLGGVSEQELPIAGPKWERINTDHMVLKYEPEKTRKQANLPLLNGAPLLLEEHTQDVLTGFQQMYHFLLAHREILLAPESPLYEMAQQQVRFLYRPTRVYALILQKLLTPRYLRNGVNRGMYLELLSRAMLPLEGPLANTEEPSRWWPIFAAERQAMEQGDIPFFTALPERASLMVGPNQHIAGCFQEPSFKLVVARLKALGPKDLDQQVGFIVGTLYAHVAHDVVHVSAESKDTNLARGLLPTPQQLTTQALAIAEQLATRAILAADGSVTWIAPQHLPRSERYQFQPLGYDLYSGACGIALFLAAVEKITGGAGLRELALGALQPLRQTLRYYGQRAASELGIGGATGLASVAYALTRVSQWLNEPALLEDARQAVRFITLADIHKDNALDILSGSAGVILGLFALHDILPDAPLFERIVAAGHRLVQARTKSETGYQAWPTLDKKLLTGFSHGAAGIAYALLRLYAMMGDEDLLAVAREGIAYESSVFVPEVGNWPDFRVEQQPSFMTTWCHGAPGIGLARLGGLSILDNAQIRKDIEIALQTTQAFGIQDMDHLCCGNLGRI
ncbi:MAG: type 2 lanthipeptide synthetase LanM family protein, partial [Ktedonobacteraceae bacterium]